MVLKVRAGVPLVWRSPSSLQFGVDMPLAIIDELDAGAERLIAALVSGISRTGFDMMARDLELDIASVERLLRQVKPALTAEEHARTDHRLVVVTGRGALADELRSVLAESSLLALPEEDAPELAVMVADWVVAPVDHGHWLRRDIPHLALVTGETGVTIGPFIEPGDGPCLYCLQLSRTDADPAWPAIASQLWTRRAPPLGRLARAEAVSFTARGIQHRLTHGPSAEATSWHLDAVAGSISSRVWMPHAACRCATPAESDWAPVAEPGSPAGTRRAAGVDVPA